MYYFHAGSGQVPTGSDRFLKIEMDKIHEACHIFMQVPDRFQQVPTPEMWIPYKVSSIFIQVSHRFQKVPNLDP